MGDQPGKFYAALAEELIAWARHQFELDIPDKGGNTGREHIKGALKRARSDDRKRALAAELAGPPLRRQLHYLWTMFNEISAGLESGGFGPATVTWQNIEAWSRLTGTSLEPLEAVILARLGQARVLAFSKS